MNAAARYEADGYLVCEKLLSAEHVFRLRDRIDEIANGEVDSFPKENTEWEPSGGAIRKIVRCAESDSVLRAHAEHPGCLQATRVTARKLL